MTSPADVLALARAVMQCEMTAQYEPGDAYLCGYCQKIVHLSRTDQHKPDCAVPIAERVIEAEGK